MAQKAAIYPDGREKSPARLPLHQDLSKNLSPMIVFPKRRTSSFSARQMSRAII
jgi:hypothetical protein